MAVVKKQKDPVTAWETTVQAVNAAASAQISATEAKVSASDAALHADQAKATIQMKSPDGSTVTKSELVGKPSLFKEPPCTVGFRLGVTIPLAPYTSGKAEVMLMVPCGHGEIDNVYVFAKKWVEDRMEVASAELHANASPTT